MKLTLTAQGIEHTEAIDQYVQQKLSDKLDTYLQHVQEPHLLHVDIGITTTRHKNGNVMLCHAHLALPGQTLHAEVEKDDLYAAIDAAHDDLKRQIIRYKEEKMR